MCCPWKLLHFLRGCFSRHLYIPTFRRWQNTLDGAGEAPLLAFGVEFVQALEVLCGVILVLWDDGVIDSQSFPVNLEAHPFNGDTVPISGQCRDSRAALYDCLEQTEDHGGELLDNARRGANVPYGSEVMLPETSDSYSAWLSFGLVRRSRERLLWRL